MLSEDQKAFYDENGYLQVSGIFSDTELDVLEAEFDGVVQRLLASGDDLDATWGGQWKEDMGPMQLQHTHDVQKFSAAWGKFLFHDGLTEVLSDLIGPNVQLHHTKLFQKPPETGSAFPMHQDYHYFPHTNNSMTAGIFHLTDANIEMGCVRVIPGSHKLGAIECHKLPDGKRAGLYLDPEKYKIEDATPLEANRGDIVFFSYLTIHGSSLNTSDRVRKTVLIQVRDPADLPTSTSHNESHAQGMMLRGVLPV